MNDIEQLVRDTLVAHETQAPPGSNLLASTRNRIARHRRVRLTASVATLIALVVAAGALIGLEGGGSSPASLTARSGTGLGPPIPNGMQAVSFHGVQVFL